MQFYDLRLDILNWVATTTLLLKEVMRYAFKNDFIKDIEKFLASVS